MEALEKLRWAEALIREKTGGQQILVAGWDGMPAIQIADGCMVGLYFALLKNRKTGVYDCRVKGYIRTCGGYNPSAWLKELTEECARIAALVAQLEAADIHADEEAVAAFCEELKRRMEPDDSGGGGE